MARGDNVPYSSVPTVESGGGGGERMGVRSNANDFGAQVGESADRAGATIKKLGGQLFEFADKKAPKEEAELADQNANDLLFNSAAEAKANSAIATQWAPATSQLKANFDGLQGDAKIQGKDDYLKGLQDTSQKIVSTATSPYEASILKSYTDNYIKQEDDNAAKLTDQSLGQFADQAHQAKLLVDGQNAINNYNNPEIVNSTLGMMNAQIEKHGIDLGLSPDEIQENQNQVRGTLAEGMIDRAVQLKDVDTARAIYAENRTFIPGYKRLEIGKVLHIANMTQVSTSNTSALLMGSPLPEQPVPGADHSVQQVRATVADTAQSKGVDPNHALTVVAIESNFGQNLGQRGDIGQTGKPGDLSQQATNMVDELKKSQTVADTALGRKAESWEGYVCYQQGAGGGPALLKASQNDPTARAVDVLMPLYKNNAKVALSAVVSNGGNANMTAAQFVGFIKQKYQANASREECEIPQSETALNQTPVLGGELKLSEPAPKTLGQAILEPTQKIGIPAQPGATPVQALSNLNEVYPDALMRANAIPNLDERRATLQALEQKHAVYQAAATAWKSQFQLKAQQLAVDPNFTDISQIPPDMAAAFSDDPHMMTYMQGRADANLTKQSGGLSKDMKEYGTGFPQAVQGVWGHTINSVDDINKLYAEGKITMSGHDKLVTELDGKKTPEGDAEADMKAQAFKAIKVELSGSNDMLGIKDPKGELLYSKFLQKALPAYEKGKAEGKTAIQLLDPDSQDYVGKYAIPLKRTIDQQMADMMQDSPVIDKDEKSKSRTLADIIKDVQSGKLASNDGKTEAIKLGLIRQDSSTNSVPSVPIAGQ